MITKHTKGTWSISGVVGDNHIMARASGDRRTVAIATGWDGLSTEEFDANKRLIASAPEMLALLNEIDSDADDTGCEDCAVVSGSVLQKITVLLAKMKAASVIQ